MAKSKKETPRASEAETQDRTLEVLAWLRSPMATQEIITKAGAEWGLEERQIKNYIAKAKEILKELFLQGADENKQIILDKLWKVYETAMEGLPILNRVTGEIDGYKPDLHAANTALKTMAQMHGLFTHKQELQINDNSLESVPTEVLLKYATDAARKGN